MQCSCIRQAGCYAAKIRMTRKYSAFLQLNCITTAHRHFGFFGLTASEKAYRTASPIAGPGLLIFACICSPALRIIASPAPRADVIRPIPPPPLLHQPPPLYRPARAPSFSRNSPGFRVTKSTRKFDTAAEKRLPDTRSGNQLSQQQDGQPFADEARSQNAPAFRRLPGQNDGNCGVAIVSRLERRRFDIGIVQPNSRIHAHRFHRIALFHRKNLKRTALRLRHRANLEQWRLGDGPDRKRQRNGNENKMDESLRGSRGRHAPTTQPRAPNIKPLNRSAAARGSFCCSRPL